MHCKIIRMECIPGRNAGWNALETRMECRVECIGLETRMECIGNQDGMHWKPGWNAFLNWLKPRAFKERSFPESHLLSTTFSWTPPPQLLRTILPFDEVHPSSAGAHLAGWKELQLLAPPNRCSVIYELATQFEIGHGVNQRIHTNLRSLLSHLRHKRVHNAAHSATFLYMHKPCMGFLRIRGATLIYGGTTLISCSAKIGVYFTKSILLYTGRWVKG